MAEGAWRNVIESSAAFLAAHSQGKLDGNEEVAAVHTHKTQQMWLCRLVAMFRMRLYTEVEKELLTFGSFDRADLCYEAYPTVYPGLVGSMVPFALRLLHAELPIHLNRATESLDRLYALRHEIQLQLFKIHEDRFEDRVGGAYNDAVTLWKSRATRVSFGIGNCLISLSDYENAHRVLAEIDDISSSSSLKSALGRVALQLGNVSLSSKYFEAAADSTASPSEVTINSGLLDLTEGRFEDAALKFGDAHKFDNVSRVATNNESVCMLYAGSLSKAITVIEKDIEKHSNNPHQSLLFNLCTLYELQSSSSVDRKRALASAILSNASDDFPIDCLKL